MPQAATYVDEKDRVLDVFLRAIVQSFIDRIEAWVHPATFALTVSAHVVVEMLEVLRPLSEPDEKMILSVVCILKWTISDVVRVLII